MKREYEMYILPATNSGLDGGFPKVREFVNKLNEGWEIVSSNMNQELVFYIIRKDY